MNQVIGMHEAKSSLSQLVQRAAKGEVIFIGPHGKAEAKLVPLESKAHFRRRIGILKGRLNVAEDFDAPLPPDVLASFESAL
jgi:prevent-host-death family protein